MDGEFVSIAYSYTFIEIALIEACKVCKVEENHTDKEHNDKTTLSFDQVEGMVCDIVSNMPSPTCFLMCIMIIQET